MNTTQRNNWDALSMKEKAAMMKVAVQNGIYDLDDIRQAYNEFADGGPEEILNKVNSSDANFVQRLKDPNRRYIQDWESDKIATHKLSVGTDEYGNNYIYPEVQEINGKLIDFTRPPYAWWAGIESAEQRGDTVRVPNLEDAIKFTEEYKQYYPKGKTFAEGGYKGNAFEIGGDIEDEYYAGTLPEVEVVAPSSNRFVAQSSSTYVAPYISEVPEIRFVGSRYDRDTLTDKGGKPASDMTYEERWERQKKEKTRQDWKNLYEGLQKTVGTSIAGANLFTGGPWAAMRLSNGNKASTAGQLFSKYLLATNALDNYNDAVDLVVNPSISGAVDLATGLALSRYRDFGSRARQFGELVGQGANTYNIVDNYKALGGPLVELANKHEDGGPYKPGTIYGRPTEEGLKTVSPEFDALLIGRVAANAAREAAGKLLNSGIEGTARQRAAITSRRFGREMAKRRDEVKGWSRTLMDDVKDGNYADVPLDLKGLTRNVWETGRYIKNTPERYVENTLPKFYRNVFRRTYNNTKPAIPMIFSDPENNE